MAYFFSFFIKTYMKSNEPLIAHGTDGKGKGLEVSTQPKLAAWFLSFLGQTMENSKYPSVPSLISLEKSPPFWSESPPSIQVQRTHRIYSSSLSWLHISRCWPENQDRSWAKHRICDGSRTKMVFHIFPWIYKTEGVVFLIRSLSPRLMISFSCYFSSNIQEKGHWISRQEVADTLRCVPPLRGVLHLSTLTLEFAWRAHAAETQSPPLDILRGPLSRGLPPKTHMIFLFCWRKMGTGFEYHGRSEDIALVGSVLLVAYSYMNLPLAVSQLIFSLDVEFCVWSTGDRIRLL